MPRRSQSDASDAASQDVRGVATSRTETGGYQFADQRPSASGYSRIQKLADQRSQKSQIEAVQRAMNEGVVQRKYDHLFNDIPKSLSNLPPNLKTERIESIRADLNELRDDDTNGVDGLHAGADQNATDFGHAQRSFLVAAEAGVGERGMRQATFLLWKYSVDTDVEQSLGNVSARVEQWHSYEKETWEALTRHTGIEE